MKLVVLIAILAGCGAQKLKVDPVKVEPIHMTIDVNLRDGEAPKPTETEAR